MGGLLLAARGARRLRGKDLDRRFEMNGGDRLQGPAERGGPGTPVVATCRVSERRRGFFAREIATCTRRIEWLLERMSLTGGVN